MSKAKLKIKVSGTAPQVKKALVHLVDAHEGKELREADFRQRNKK